MKKENDKPTGQQIKAVEETDEVKTWKEMFRQMEEQGLQPMVCDTPVPFYDVPVPCGDPKSLGEVPIEFMMMPHDLGSTDSSFMARVSGDSMKDADIESENIVRVITGRRIYDGDVVLVKADDEWTAKAICVDDDGQPWLIPQNNEFTAFPLTKDQNVKVAGVITEVVKPVPRVSYRKCMDLINKAKKTRQTKLKEYTPQQVDRVIGRMASQIMIARHWFGVYRVLADLKIIKEEDFDGFCQMVTKVVPLHEHLPQEVEMSRLNLGCFKKPLAEWNIETAPVKGKRYYLYLHIGQETEKAFETLKKNKKVDE